MINEENIMKRNKKHTPTNDIGYGTKKQALTDMNFDNSDFDTLNELFVDDNLNGDMDFDVIDEDLRWDDINE